MSVLSAQSIRELCIGPQSLVNRPLVSPFVERGVFDGKSYGLSACTYDCRIDHSLALHPGQAALASTIEEFCLPDNVCGGVLDKSSYARVFVSAFNTHLDPGWFGFLTVELVNHGRQTVVYDRGAPVCQIKFEWLDKPTDRPYASKYQGQERGPQPARYEAAT